MENFKDFDSQYGKVSVDYRDGKVVIVFTPEQETELGRAEAELIMQEYIDSLGKSVEVGDAFEYKHGCYAAQVFDKN